MSRWLTYYVEAHGVGPVHTIRARTSREAMAAACMTEPERVQLVQAIEGGEVWEDPRGWHHTVRQRTTLRRSESRGTQTTRRRSSGSASG